MRPARDELKIVFGNIVERVIAVREQGREVRGAVGPAEIIADLGVALAIGAEAVEGDVVSHRQFSIVAEVERLNLRVAIMRAVAAPLGIAGVGRGNVRFHLGAGEAAGRYHLIDSAVGRQAIEVRIGRWQVPPCTAALADIATDRQETARIADLGAIADGTLPAVGTSVGAIERSVGEIAAQPLFLRQLDVDDPGNGVRSILRGGGILQDLNSVDGTGGDEIQIHRIDTRCIGWTVVEERTVVPTLAVDQHQGVAG